MTIEQLQSAINDIAAKIEPLERERLRLRRELARLKSQEFIRVNGIRRADVELSYGDRKPHFGILATFSKWMKTNSTKRWLEWNGCVYHRDCTDTPALMEDVPE